MNVAGSVKRRKFNLHANNFKPITTHHQTNERISSDATFTPINLELIKWKHFRIRIKSLLLQPVTSLSQVGVCSYETNHVLRCQVFILTSNISIRQINSNRKYNRRTEQPKRCDSSWNVFRLNRYLWSLKYFISMLNLVQI